MHISQAVVMCSEWAGSQGDYEVQSGQKGVLRGEGPKSESRLMIWLLWPVCSAGPGVQWSS